MYSAGEVERRWMDVRSMKLTIVEAVTRVRITMTFKEQQKKKSLAIIICGNCASSYS